MRHDCDDKMDFDEWRDLASSNPEQFEAMRLLMIEEVISSASEHCRQRLRGLQWRIDVVRQRSANPMAACIALSDMMWETFAGERGLVQVLNQYSRGELHPQQQRARLLAFPCSRD